MRRANKPHPSGRSCRAIQSRGRGGARSCDHGRSFSRFTGLAAFSPRSLDIDVVLDLMIHDIDIVLSLVPAAGARSSSRRHSGAVAEGRYRECPRRIREMAVSPISRQAGSVLRRPESLRFFQPHDYISVDYASQTGIMVSLRMGAVMERKLEPPSEEPLKLELASFVECVHAASERPSCPVKMACGRLSWRCALTMLSPNDLCYVELNGKAKL